jgi:hypothetical protein
MQSPLIRPVGHLLPPKRGGRRLIQSAFCRFF